MKLFWTRDKVYKTSTAAVDEGKYQIEGRSGDYTVWYYPAKVNQSGAPSERIRLIGLGHFYNMIDAKAAAQADEDLRVTHDAYRGRAIDAVREARDLIIKAICSNTANGYAVGEYQQVLTWLDSSDTVLNRVQIGREKDAAVGA